MSILKTLSPWMFTANALFWALGIIGTKIMFLSEISNLIAHHADIPTLFWGIFTFAIWLPNENEEWNLMMYLLFAFGIFLGIWYFLLSL